MSSTKCPECGSTNTRIVKKLTYKHGLAVYWHCNTCGADWQTG